MGIKRAAISMLLGAFWLCASGSQSVAQSMAQTESVGVAGTTLTTLHSFTGTDGETSFAGLVQGKNGNLYGTTNFGGAKNDGEHFQITTAEKLTIRHRFCSIRGSAV